MLRVLIADDQPDIADVLAELLRLSLPCEVTVAYDGLTALQLAVDTQPDAVVLDLYMPGLDGIAVAARLRAECHPAPCLIALTGEPDAARRLPAIDANFDRVFAKPLDSDQLVAALSRLLGEAPRPQASFNLAELFTRATRQVVPVAVGRGLAFSFDHEGPGVVVEGDAVEVHCGLHRLLLGAVDMLASGFAMFRVHVSLSPSGDCAVVVEAAGAGELQPPEVISGVLARLALVEAAPVSSQALAAGVRTASGTCPNTGAPVSFSSQPQDGLLLRAVLTYAGTVEDTAARPAPVGEACAWLVDASPQPSAWLQRRLQRLGWQVCRFDSLAQAQDRLHARPAGEPGCDPPLLLVVVEGPGILLAEAAALQRALPSSTHCMLAAMAGSDALGTPGNVPCYEVSVYPFSPRELAELSLLAGPASTGRNLGSVQHQGLRDRPVVLLVDDNEINRIVGRGLVEALGYEVRTANDGLDAIDHCRQAPPRVVLMDLDMPVLSGLEATLRLRELQRRGEVAPFAIVAATADASPAARAACERVGMDAYMTKPFTSEALQSQLRRFTAAV